MNLWEISHLKYSINCDIYVTVNIFFFFFFFFFIETLRLAFTL